MGLYEHLPYTNIHNLNEDWILSEVKKALEEWNATKAEWSITKTEWAEYKNYIDQYFANLDVTEEVRHILHEMLLAGELDGLINQALTDQIPPAVTEWLEANVDPVGSAVIVDSSLTIPGAAADAKATGDELDLRMEFMPTIIADTNLNDLSGGCYILATGHVYTNTPEFYSSGVAWVVVVGNRTDSHRLQLFWQNYNKNMAVRSMTTVGDTVTWSDWKLYNPDPSLSIEGRPADAKATGDELALKYGAKTPINYNIDLDDVRERGVYVLYTNKTYTNAPVFYTTGAAWLAVIDSPDNNFIVQIFTRTLTKQMAARSYTTSAGTGTWSEWTDLTANAAGGRKVSILGDSISSYAGQVPSGYTSYYPQGDVNNVSKTWWQQLLRNTSAVLLKNASWSGSGVCYRSDDPAGSARCGYSDKRIADLADGQTAPDIVLCFIGTNDWIRGNDIGSLGINDDIPDGTTPITTFKEAYACMLNKIRNTYPAAVVFCATLLERYTLSDNTYPILNGNGVSVAQYNDVIKEVADWLGCYVIEIDKAMSLGEVPDLTVDGRLHPNAAGMTRVYQQFKKYLDIYYTRP